MKHAATIWGAFLECDVEILIKAAFSAGLPCSGDSAVLGGGALFALLPLLLPLGMRRGVRHRESVRGLRIG